MFTLLPSMQTGIAQLDAEHHDLVAAINRIGEAERQGAIPEVLKRLREFRDELGGHFKSEEHYLRLLGYPAVDSHAKHHGEILAALDRMLEAIVAGILELGQIAVECFHELLGAVCTMDMRFLNWREEQQRRAD